MSTKAANIKNEFNARKAEYEGFVAINSILRDFYTLVIDPLNITSITLPVPTTASLNKFKKSNIKNKLREMWQGTDPLFIDVKKFKQQRMGKDFIISFLYTELNSSALLKQLSPNGVSWSRSSAWRWFNFSAGNTFQKRTALSSLRDLIEDRIVELGLILNQLNEQYLVETRQSLVPPPKKGSKKKTTTINPNELLVNVGCVKTAYFNQNSDFRNITGGALNSNNRPSSINAARQLWNDSRAHKGLIQIFIPSSGQLNVFDSVATGLKPVQQRRYGFQFHYNPGSIDMAYGGTPEIDVNMEATGIEKFNLYGNMSASSTIAIQLVLNRVMDHQYYDDSLGKLLPQYQTVYAPRRPSDEEQFAISRKGTMYDVEALLATLVGFKTETDLRGTTSDIGWITGRTLEVHLGRSLRYRGYIQSVGVKHVMFTEKMVPIFSTVQLDIRRIPDYAGNENRITEPKPKKDSSKDPDKPDSNPPSQEVVINPLNGRIVKNNSKLSNSDFQSVVRADAARERSLMSRK
jgi:hypothetical protein